MFSQNKEEVDVLLKESKTLLDYKKALSVTDSALKIATSINYKEGILKSKFSKIIIYFGQYENTECLKMIDNIEDEVFRSKDYTLIAHMESLKGAIYLRLQFKANARAQLNSALFYSDKILNDDERHHRKGIVYMQLAYLNDDSEIKNYIDVVFQYMKKAYQEFSLVKNDSDREGFIATCNMLGSYYTVKKDFASAKFYFNKAIAISQRTECIKCQPYTWNRIGNMYKEMKDYDNAIKNYEKSIEICKSTGDLIQLKENYRDLSEIYEKLNNIEKQKENLKLLKTITDSINNQNNLALGVAVQGITKDISSEHEENTNYLKLYIIIGIVLCILLSYIVFMYLKKYQTAKENSEKLEKFLEKKTLFIQSLNSNKSIIEKEEELKIVIRMAMTNDVLFFQTFNVLFPDFKEKLIQLDPFMKVNDLKFCSYLKLNFDTKEIARYTGDSIRSVESKKYRLRKKFNISSQEDINAWMSNL